MSSISSAAASRRSILAGISAALAACSTPGTNSPDLLVVIETTEGRIEVLVERDRAPKLAAWFLGLVDAGAFDGTRFFRAGHPAGQPDRPRFLEGGMISRFFLNDTGAQPRTAAEAGLPLLRDWETTADSGMRHTRGSFGFARDINGDGSVAPDFVIALEDLPEFNYGSDYSLGKLGFPVVGRVVSGMDVVDRIVGGPRGGKSYFPILAGQILTNPVTMTRVARVRR